MAKATTRFGRFSWKLVDVPGGTTLSAQPLDDAAVSLFNRNDRKGGIYFSLKASCTDEQMRQLRDLLDECVSAVGLLEFDEGPQVD